MKTVETRSLLTPTKSRGSMCPGLWVLGNMVVRRSGFGYNGQAFATTFLVSKGKSGVCCGGGVFDRGGVARLEHTESTVFPKVLPELGSANEFRQ